MTGAVVMTPYQFIVGFEEFMAKIHEDRDFVEKVISMCMDYYVDIVTHGLRPGGLVHLPRRRHRAEGQPDHEPEGDP